MENKVTIKAPASIANLGSGFDTMGIALSLFNTVELQEWDSITVRTTDGTVPVQGEQNLIYETVKAVYDECGRSLPGLALVQTSPIPQARGLGSSSACIAAGIVGANRLLGQPMTENEQVAFAAKLEGHPDNVAPAMLGGFVTSVMENGKVYTVKKRVSDDLRFFAFVPDFELLTEKARAALPDTVPRADAIYNVSRAALMAAAFCEGKPELFAVGAQDKLHQPYRLPLIPGAKRIFKLAPQLGAKAVFIGGAGPTIIAVCDVANLAFAPRAILALQEDEATNRFSLQTLTAHNESMF